MRWIEYIYHTQQNYKFRINLDWQIVLTMMSIDARNACDNVVTKKKRFMNWIECIVSGAYINFNCINWSLIYRIDAVLRRHLRCTSRAKQDRFIVLGIFWPSLERRWWPYERWTLGQPSSTSVCVPCLYEGIQFRRYGIVLIGKGLFFLRESTSIHPIISIPRAALRDASHRFTALDRDVSALLAMWIIR